MNHKASIYTNPLIPASLYYSKLLDVHVATGEQPYLWACLLTGPAYGDASGVRLASIIYRTEKSEELIAKFRLTFRIEEDTIDSYVAALGRWGCVSVFDKEYHGQKFSCVTYVQQNMAMQKTSRLFEKREQIIGGIEWPEHTDPSIAAPKEEVLLLPECPEDAVEPTANGWGCDC